jgi:hypothetical protein
MYNNWSTCRGSKLQPNKANHSSWVTNEVDYLLRINNIVNENMKNVHQPVDNPTDSSKLKIEWIKN